MAETDADDTADRAEDRTSGRAAGQARERTEERRPRKKADRERPGREEDRRSAATERAASDGTPDQPRGPRSGEILVMAAEQVVRLTGKEFEGISGFERTEDGWRVEVELLELRRVPNTTDVIATYEVQVDGGGDLVGYRRLRRYVRGEAGEE